MLFRRLALSLSTLAVMAGLVLQPAAAEMHRHGFLADMVNSLAGQVAGQAAGKAADHLARRAETATTPTGTAALAGLQAGIQRDQDTTRRLVTAYLDDVETITHRRLLPLQRENVTAFFVTGKYRDRDKEELRAERDAFNEVRADLLKQWVAATGQPWPVYDEPVYSKSGRPYIRPGQNYDAHHLIELDAGGPNVWWNMHPAKNPSEHQGGIHRHGGALEGLLAYMKTGKEPR